MKYILHIFLGLFLFQGFLIAGEKPDTIFTAKRNKLYKKYMGENPVYTDKDPQFFGDARAIEAFFNKHLTYPDSVDRKNLDGNAVLLKFVVTDQGIVRDVSVLESLHPAYDDEAIRVIKLMPVKPGEKNGYPVFTEMIYEVSFKKLKSKALPKLDKTPSFPGGEAAMMSFIRRNLKYPEEAQRNNIEGRVVIRFIVCEDGKIDAAEVLSGIDPECDAEALKVVESMPEWSPGIFKGKPVTVHFNLPLQFRLRKQTSTRTQGRRINRGF
ncbi:energy transducer TonB [Dysgonomonas reticulitermitis]